MNREEIDGLRVSIATVEAEVEKRAQNRFKVYFPDCGPECDLRSTVRAGHRGLCRALYVKPMAFMAAGAQHRERLFLAANQIGKTESAAYEVTAHLTGLYPSWWRGRRFAHAGEWWIAGDTMLSTRNILQVAMLGPIDGVETRCWSGMLPPHTIMDITRKSGGVALCVDTVWVKHATGKNSTAQFLSYDQGRKVFQGTGKTGIWIDEEPPEGEDIYSECLTRTVNTNGIMISTFTPLRGLTPFIQQYLETAVLVDGAGDARSASEVFFPQ